MHFRLEDSKKLSKFPLDSFRSYHVRHSHCQNHSRPDLIPAGTDDFFRYLSRLFSSTYLRIFGKEPPALVKLWRRSEKGRAGACVDSAASQERCTGRLKWQAEPQRGPSGLPTVLTARAYMMQSSSARLRNEFALRRNSEPERPS